MKKKIFIYFAAVAGSLLISVTNGFSFSSLGTNVNTACAPLTPYTGDCTLCHTGDFADPTPAKEAYLAGGTTLTNYFCPSAPNCTDSDGDTYAVEGGDCGPVDCNDADPAINPAAAENCTDNIDNNCNGLIDAQDPAAVGCQTCTDSDADGFAVEGGDCGPVDCNDNDGAINPGAVDIPNNGIDENCDGVDSVDPSLLDNDGDGFTPAQGDCDDTDSTINPNAIEICTDTIDNNCNGLVDAQDPDAVDCPQSCTDNDGDTYAIDGGDCGPVDCDDANPNVNPGTMEICEDGIDNNCSGEIDEGCDPTCPDADSDGYQDAACGGTDCNDNDATINPGAAEICGNGIDENCNGASDDTCLTCPDGTLLVIKKAMYIIGPPDMLKIKGRATAGTTITIMNADTDQILAEGIEVKGGQWRAKIKNIGGQLTKVRVMTSNGCSVEKAVKTNKKKDKDDEGEGEDKVGEIESKQIRTKMNK
ncbi:MAG: putative metal-binding motif-containing protein [Desulfobulbaceae bacterium]